MIFVGASQGDIILYAQEDLFRERKIDPEMKKAFDLGDCLGRAIATGTNDYILMLRDWEFDIPHIKSLSHEIKHLLDLILEDAGQERIPDSEWEAYFIGYLTESILNELCSTSKK